jgi:O-antigen/teichoic acid export membrane protein
MPIAILLLLAGQEIIEIAFGADYASISYGPLVILVLAQLINVLFGSAGYLLTMSGYEKDVVIGLVGSVVVSSILSAFLIPLYGAEGVAYAILVATFVLNFILYKLTKRRLNVTSFIL